VARTGSSSAPSAIKSTATGPAPARSSSWTAGRATAPAPPSRTIASVTAACGWPVTPSPASPGTSCEMNRRRSPRIYGSCSEIDKEKN